MRGECGGLGAGVDGLSAKSCFRTKTEKKVFFCAISLGNRADLNYWLQSFEMSAEALLSSVLAERKRALDARCKDVNCQVGSNQIPAPTSSSMMTSCKRAPAACRHTFKEIEVAVGAGSSNESLACVGDTGDDDEDEGSPRRSVFTTKATHKSSLVAASNASRTSGSERPELLGASLLAMLDLLDNMVASPSAAAALADARGGDDGPDGTVVSGVPSLRDPGRHSILATSRAHAADCSSAEPLARKVLERLRELQDHIGLKRDGYLQTISALHRMHQASLSETTGVAQRAGSELQLERERLVRLQAEVDARVEVLASKRTCALESELDDLRSERDMLSAECSTHKQRVELAVIERHTALEESKRSIAESRRAAEYAELRLRQRLEAERFEEQLTAVRARTAVHAEAERLRGENTLMPVELAEGLADLSGAVAKAEEEAKEAFRRPPSLHTCGLATPDDVPNLQSRHFQSPSTALWLADQTADPKRLPADKGQTAPASSSSLNVEDTGCGCAAAHTISVSLSSDSSLSAATTAAAPHLNQPNERAQLLSSAADDEADDTSWMAVLEAPHGRGSQHVLSSPPSPYADGPVCCRAASQQSLPTEFSTNRTFADPTSVSQTPPGCLSKRLATLLEVGREAAAAAGTPVCARANPRVPMARKVMDARAPTFAPRASTPEDLPRPRPQLGEGSSAALSAPCKIRSPHPSDSPRHRLHRPAMAGGTAPAPAAAATAELRQIPCYAQLLNEYMTQPPLPKNTKLAPKPAARWKL